MNFPDNSKVEGQNDPKMFSFLGGTFKWSAEVVAMSCRVIVNIGTFR